MVDRRIVRADVKHPEQLVERTRAAALQERLGCTVTSSGHGYAIIDYDALELLADRLAGDVSADFERTCRMYGGGRLGDPSPMTVAHMESQARGRLDYNGSRSGYAAPATELARYVLALAAGWRR